VTLNQAIKALKGQVAALATPASTAAATTATQVSQTSQTVVVNSAGAAIGAVNNQTGAASYSTGQTDNGAFIILNSASPVAFTLTSSVSFPWFCIPVNQGTGLVTLTPFSGTINGAASMTLASGYFALVSFDGTNFWAATLPIGPQTFTAVLHEFLTAYNAATGVFSAAQPSFPDISGNLATSQLPIAGLSVTITTAKLSSGGTQGSMTFTAGLLTAQVQAT
jgi:hypothetical protein